VLIKIGDKVKAGDPVFYDKANPDVFFCAPMSGEFTELRRGAKRSVKELVFKADTEVEYREFPKANPADLDKESIIKQMKDGGAWPFIIQRPYGILADANVTPKAIFISGFDTAPGAADINFILEGKEAAFQAGIDALSKLTDGAVNLTLADNETYYPAEWLKNVNNANINWISGKCKHPAGNVGVHIHHIDAINKEEVVWTVKADQVAIIGKLFTEGKFDASKVVAVGGTEIESPQYFNSYMGASIESMIDAAGLKMDHVRYISGNILCGDKIEKNGFLGIHDNTVSVLEEGDKYEFMGWQIPLTPRPSLSRTFASTWARLFGASFEYDVSTNTHGEERAYVISGQYEPLVPMDLLPNHLIKSIMYKDLEEMEGLGIYEVLEEDLALCEFACTSKVPVTKVLREGLDLIRKEG
jgi:Na+-transporting NADH:ubiquinone oxidoreductase subunit A